MKNFKNWLKVNGYSDSTLAIYTPKVKHFLNTIGENYTEENVNKYLLDIQEGRSAETVNLYRKSLKKWFEFKNIDIKLPKSLKVEHKLPDSISEEYFLTQLIPTTDMVFTNPLKVKAILYLMFYTGLRKGEIILLKRENINLKEGYAKIYCPKTRTERILMIPNKAKTILKYYFDTEGEEQNAMNIGIGGINNIFIQLKPFFKDINLRPHLMRHSFATMLLKNKIDVAYVSKALGHKNITSTQRYLDLDVNDILKEINEKLGD